MRLAEVFHPSRRNFAIAATLLILAVILGGGGTPNPSTEFWLELLAGAAVLAWIWLAAPLTLSADRLIWFLAGLVLVVPLLQLVPLPPSVWSALPGRETQAAALGLVGAEDSWRPLSTSPARTLASLLSIMPPLFLMLAAAALPTRDRRWLIGMVGALALVGAVLGALQLAGGGAAFKLYQASSSNVVSGFQANRNAAVDVMLIGMLALAAFAAGLEKRSKSRGNARSDGRFLWLCASILLLALAGVLTSSRAGIALLLPVLFACWAIAAPGAANSRKHLYRWTLLGAAILLALGGVLLRYSHALKPVVARFQQTGEARPELWSDTLYAIGQYMPFGSGIGTFVPTFIALEPLEAVDPSTPNRAHNDYLELALETGIIGVAALILAVAVVLFMAVRRWRQRDGESRPQILFALGALAVVAAHSLVDYPMRSMALACLAALAAAMLATSRADRPHGEGAPPPLPKRSTLPLRLALTLPMLAFLFAAWGNGLDRQSAMIPTLEGSVPGPFRAAADRSAAAMTLARGLPEEALAFAENAVRRDPIDPLAASLLGSARQFLGDQTGAQAAFRVSAQGGWRDPLAQLYWYDAALGTGDTARAATRLDAFLRAQPGFPASSALLQPLEASEEGRAALALRLAEEPSWINAYLNFDYARDPALARTRAEVARRIAANGRTLGCKLPRGLTLALLAQGMRREAAELWEAHCGESVPIGGLADGGFEFLAKDSVGSPFGWTRNSGGDVSAEIVDAANGGKEIRASNRASVTRWVLLQPAGMSPGRYILRADIRVNGAPAAGRMVASLDCDGRMRQPASPQGDPAGSGQFITIGTCAKPVLALWLRPGAEDVTIDNVEIKRLD